MNAQVKFTWISLIALFGLFFSGDARADIHPGFRAGAYFDAGSAFVGGEIVNSIGEHWRIVPNVEWVFVDDANEATFNFDFQYDIPTHYSVDMWAGAGPAIIYFNPDNPRRGSDTDFGVNLFYGIGFPLRDAQFMPYVQSKVILSDNSEFALAFGLRF